MVLSSRLHARELFENAAEFPAGWSAAAGSRFSRSEDKEDAWSQKFDVRHSKHRLPNKRWQPTARATSLQPRYRSKRRNHACPGLSRACRRHCLTAGCS